MEYCSECRREMPPERKGYSACEECVREAVEHLASIAAPKEKRASVGEDWYHYPGQSASFHTEIG